MAIQCICMSALKVTLTLPGELLETVDQYVTEHPKATRSGVCASALREWLARQQEAAIERYYGEMGEAEREENAGWAALAARSATGSWR
jgi:metal-responsive CopG/Arc/MetJ family transcriptional regulator